MDHWETELENVSDSCGSEYEPLAGPCEHVNEPSGYIKFVEFFLDSVEHTTSFSIKS
jgi:hypothetical protein